MKTLALAELAAQLRAAGLLRDVHGQLPMAVTGVVDDSRHVEPGSLFVAVRGTSRDGHQFLGAAAKAGATAAIVQDATGSPLPSLVVNDARGAAATAAAVFYGYPARAMSLVAATGTNGKTTSVAMVRHLLDEPNARAASIGTLGALIGSEGKPFMGGDGLTTPGAIEMQRLLRALMDTGIRTVALEASSHALHQGRLDGVTFAAGIFTNLTRDHLDYHLTMESYFAAKASLVDMIAPNGTVVVNADDRAWNALPSGPRRLSFGFSDGADVRATDVRYSQRGTTWTLLTGGKSYQVTLPLIGDFNVVNALGAATAAVALGRRPSEVVAKLAAMPQVPGRLEILSESPLVLRDYAHTPDALDRAIRAVTPFAQRGRVIVVFGCGGDRDPGKRPLMGEVAERLAQHVIITSDNPRTEDPEKILDAIEAGMKRKTHERIEDRREAIARAISVADPGRDIVLLAGKGHEDYQIRGTEKLPFDESLIVRTLLAERV